MNKLNTKMKLFMFKHAIEFFSNYTLKLFDKNYTINWYCVFRDLIVNNIFSTECNEYLFIINNFSNSENDSIEYKEACIKYFLFIVNNYKNLYVFYDIPKEKLELYSKKNDEYILNKNIEKFNSSKCFRCKNYYKIINLVNNEGILFNINCLSNKDEKYIKNNYFINNDSYCTARNELIENLMKYDTYPYNREKRTNDKLNEEKDIPEEFKFIPVLKDNEKYEKWTLKPISNNTPCKFFKLDESMTYDKFIEKYFII